jgi:hypothetical protein
MKADVILYIAALVLIAIFMIALFGPPKKKTKT